MKVRMKRTALGSEDGAHVRQYDEGVEYELSRDLALTLIESGVAESPENMPASKTRPSRKKQ